MLWICISYHCNVVHFSYSIFLPYICSHQQATCLYERHARQLLRIRNLDVPPVPKTIDDIIKLFDRADIFDTYGRTKHTDGRETFLDYIHKGSDYNFMIFSNKRIIALIKKHIKRIGDRKYHIDATFYKVPYGCFEQFLIIHLEKFDTVHPFIFVLMDKRTAPAYTHVFNYINEHIFDLSALSFNSDFEKAMRNSLRHCFPTSKLRILEQQQIYIEA